MESRYLAFTLLNILFFVLSFGAVSPVGLKFGRFSGGTCLVGSIVDLTAGFRTRYKYTFPPFPTDDYRDSAFS